MSKKDYYEVLGIARDASSAEIKKQYRKIAIKYHPDTNPGDKSAEEKFKELSEAYHVLSDSKRRSAYDQFGHSGPGGGFYGSSSGGGFEDVFSGGFSDVFDGIFNNFMGGKSSSSEQDGSDLQYNLQISFKDAIQGNSIKIEFPRQRVCSDCSGTGAQSKSDIVICSTCQGTGYTRIQQSFIGITSTCRSCGGLGKTIVVPCSTCHGETVVQEKKEIKIQIPKGVNTGAKIRFTGEGEQPKGKGRIGDLYVVFHVEEHDFFQRKGNDIIFELPINITTATVGGKIIVPTLDGKTKFTIPAGTSNGKVFRLRNKGIAARDSKGDLLVKILIDIPVNISKKQKKLLMDLEETFEQYQNKKIADYETRMEKNIL